MISRSLLIKNLKARLPELDWMLSHWSIPIASKSLPRGLFKDHLEITSQTCIEEIKADVLALEHHTDDPVLLYLAEKIRQKINVLVGLFQIHSTKVASPRTHITMQSISTRQQWLKSLEEEVERLTEQRIALMKTLENNGDIQATLHLKAEIGEIEKRLTQVTESLQAK